MTLLNKDTIFLNQNFSTQEEIFSFIAKVAIDLNIADSREDVYKDLINRENQGTTGMMDGFAIPHASNNSIINPSIIIIKNNIGIEWNSMDGQAIDFIICLLIPSDQKSTTHLEILKDISKMLMHKDIRVNLHNSQNKEDILDILNIRY